MSPNDIPDGEVFQSQGHCHPIAEYTYTGGHRFTFEIELIASDILYDVLDRSSGFRDCAAG